MNEKDKQVFSAFVKKRGYKEGFSAEMIADDAFRFALEYARGQQEPVDKVYICNSCGHAYQVQPPSQCDCLGDEQYTEGCIYTTPPAAQPVRLTRDEIEAARLEWCQTGWDVAEYTEAIMDAMQAKQLLADAIPTLIKYGFPVIESNKENTLDDTPASEDSCKS